MRRWLGGGQKETTTRAYRLADDLKELTPGLYYLLRRPCSFIRSSSTRSSSSLSRVCTQRQKPTSSVEESYRY